MNVPAEYKRVHQNPVNLAIHVLTVPVFALALPTAVVFLLRQQFLLAALSLLLMPLMMAFQGIGHRLEAHPPEQFTSFGNMVGRIMREQYVMFWLFLAKKTRGKS